jgi:hypothetical protein
MFWVAPAPYGNDLNPGSSTLPWATLDHASQTVPDLGCTVWFSDGIYTGSNRITERFESFTLFKAVHPYKVILQNAGPALSITGGRHMILEGFVFQHTGPEASRLVVQISRRDNDWAEFIIFRNNIFRNSYNDDLLKIYNGARFVTVENNLFYNQGNAEQQIDVNSVTDVTIQDNIFFNDFAAGNRPLENNTKHYIVIKDSNEGDDGLLGDERILVQRNIFLNWQGGVGETFIQVGNDGKPYYEAKDVTIQNNLFLGNSPNPMAATFGVSGATDIHFINNTISGNLPSKAYAAQINIKDQNPKNNDILLCNNIWSDPTGSMGSLGDGDTNEFAGGDPANSLNLVLDNNLYWNGGKKLPNGDLLSPLKDDAHRFIADPGLVTDFDNLVLPLWNGSTFPDGNTSIRNEFLYISRKYGSPSSYSPAFRNASRGCAPKDDIFGQARGFYPNFGADQGHTDIITSTPTNIAAIPSDTPTFTPSPTPAVSDLIFADGFESGSFSAWSSSTTGGGDLSVTPAALLAGTNGMQLLINDTTSIYVTDNTPNLEPRYRTRFYFDPNSITMANNEMFTLFYGFSGSTSMLRVDFRFSGGVYQLMARALDDGAIWSATPWFTISDAPHSIEFDWQASTAFGANNGTLAFWIDGAQLSTLTGIDNDTRRIDSIRLGAVTGLDTGTIGIVYFDVFESRWQDYTSP